MTSEKDFLRITQLWAEADIARKRIAELDAENETLSEMLAEALVFVRAYPGDGAKDLALRIARAGSGFCLNGCGRRPIRGELYCSGSCEMEVRGDLP